MPQEVDPVTLVYDALMRSIAERPVVKSLVKDKNLISFTDNRNEQPLKKNIGAGDIPEIQLWAENSSARFLSSDAFILETTFTAVVVTGSYLLHRLALPLQFETVCAWVDWRRHLSPLTYKGNGFVSKVDFAGATLGEGDALRNRGITGWTVLNRITVQMTLQMSTLQLGD